MFRRRAPVRRGGWCSAVAGGPLMALMFGPSELMPRTSPTFFAKTSASREPKKAAGKASAELAPSL